MMRIKTPAEITNLIAAQSRAGFDFRNPIYRALLAGEIGAVSEIAPRKRIPRDAFWHPRPAIIILGDDAGVSNGPHDFPDAARAFAWAASAMIHAAAGQAHHYEAAAIAARLTRRVLLIETRTANEIGWDELAMIENAKREKLGARPLAVLLIRVPAHMPAHPSGSKAEGAHAHG